MLETIKLLSPLESGIIVLFGYLAVSLVLEIVKDINR